jgi:hypothetical protein
MKTIDLGYANGWDKETNELYKELQKFKIENTSTSKNIGNCVNEYSFETMQDNEIVKVIYKVDSGD